MTVWEKKTKPINSNFSKAAAYFKGMFTDLNVFNRTAEGRQYNASLRVPTR
jgi:hypothetical protein